MESSHPAVTSSGTPLPAMRPASLQALMSVTRLPAFGATSSVQRTVPRSPAASHLGRVAQRGWAAACSDVNLLFTKS